VILIAISVPALSEGRFAARQSSSCQDHFAVNSVWRMTQFRLAQRSSPIALGRSGWFTKPLGVTRCGCISRVAQRSPHHALSVDHRGCAFWRSNPTGFGMGTENRLVNENVSQTPMLVSSGHSTDWGAISLGRNVRGSVTPKRSRVMRAIEKLRWIQMTAGGQYATRSESGDGEHFSPPRFQGRTISRVQERRRNHPCPDLTVPFRADSRSATSSG